jgi:hypothetical protein
MKRTIKKLAKYTTKVIVINTLITLVAVSAVLYTYSIHEEQKNKELSVRFSEALIVAKTDPSLPISGMDQFNPDQKLAIQTVKQTASEQSSTVRKLKSMYVYCKQKAVDIYEEVKNYLDEKTKSNS